MAPKRNNAPQTKKSAFSQFGLMDLPDLSTLDNLDDLGSDSDEDDGSLEAELQAILSGKAPIKTQRRPKTTMDVRSIEQIAAEAVQDVSSDEAGDDNLSGDEDLVAELMKISKSSPSPVLEETAPPAPPPRASSAPSTLSMASVLQERLQMYKAAEADAKSSGNTGKARRYGRGITTLEGLLKMALAGKAIDEEEIPPPIAIPKPKPQESADFAPIPPAETTDAMPPPSVPKRPSLDKPDRSSESTVIVEDPILATLTKRRDQFKIAALQAKKTGDTQTAVKYIRTAKQFDTVIEAHSQGQPVDLSNMPEPPPPYGSAPVQESAKQSSPAAPTALARRPAPPPPAEPAPPLPAAVPEGFHIPDDSETQDPTLFGAPPPPTSILEALEQRLAKFQSTLDAAQEQGSTSKARRIGRIVKQYQDAIKFHKAGKQVDFQELPVPPGFSPFPGEEEFTSSSAAKEPPSDATPEPRPPSQPRPAAPKPATPGSQPPPPPRSKQPHVARQPSVTNRLTKQLEFLHERQRLFREAALEAKKKGDLEQAKEYLRMAKGIDPMIEGTRNGLPVNISSIPTPPQLTEDFVVIEVENKRPTVPGLPGDPNELFRKLEMDLVKQIEMCVKNKDHFMQLADIGSVSKFEKLAHDTHKDLDVIRNLWDRGDPLPKFHYETRIFSLVISNTDLGNNDLELVVIRGIDLPGKPTDLDSYLRIEFPYPSDASPKAKTHTVRDTNNPEFNAVFKFDINRKSRSFARIVKRQAVKIEVWSKGGFLRNDVLLGTVYIKLVDLETKCTVHNCFDLLQNRKPCGGKIEAKMRVRDPFLAKQIEEVKEKWLVIGS